MSDYVLLSPIGSTDPVRDDHDGALLHIVRHYKPRKVYLYYTKEMQGKSELVLKALEPFNVEVEEINSNIKDPSNYDAFAGVFDDILIKIQKENENSRILLNITSGTPQMKSALCLEVVTSYLDLKPIQVITPGEKSNENLSHGGDIANNLDDLMERGKYLSTNRCVEPNILSFRRSSVKRDVTSLVEHFEYRAALERLKENKNLFSQEVIELVKYAALRQNDDNECRKSKWNEEFNYTKNVNAKLACDYYCILDNKAKTGELSYFVLLLKPLAEHIARDYIGEFKDNEVYDALKEYYIEKYRKEYHPEVYKRKTNYNLEQYIIIMEFKSKPKSVVDKYFRLNDEINKRNKLAHTLFRVDELNTNELLKIFKLLIKETYGNAVKEDSFYLYKNINDRIIKML
ncbi:MAG: hypothetical protein WBK75_04305 [Acutalibacteraceae bacterium]|jgi:CRISPR type III-A/MTUBE-associated protein Csm6